MTIKEVSQKQVPRYLRARRSKLSRYLAKTTLRIFGWEVSGNIPDEERIVIIAAPHTSNWDFVLAIAALFALNINIKCLGKDSLLRPGLSWFFKGLGVIPVNIDNPAFLIYHVLKIVEKEKAGFAIPSQSI